MSKEYTEKVNAYMLAVAVAKEMLHEGIIDDKDFIKIEEKLVSKYCISKQSLYRQNPLISTPPRGNMCTDREE